MTLIFGLYGAILCEYPLNMYTSEGYNFNYECRLQAHQRLIVANGGKPIKMVSVWSSGLTNMPCLSTKNFAVQGKIFFSNGFILNLYKSRI